MTLKKILTGNDLAEIVAALLTNPMAAGQDFSPETHAQFLREIATVVADHCGGQLGLDELQRHALSGNDVHHADMVVIEGNDSLPEDGGIWAPYPDLDGDGDQRLTASGPGRNEITTAALEAIIGQGRKLVVVQHNHSEGDSSLHHAILPINWGKADIARTMIRVEGIDYEPERGESLRSYRVNSTEVTVYEPADLVTEDAMELENAGAPAP